MNRHQLGLAAGNLMTAVGRLIRPMVPKKLAQAVDDRFFGAVFQVTRVTNDNYGNGTQESPAQPDENG
jgi:hypothetical protein